MPKRNMQARKWVGLIETSRWMGIAMLLLSQEGCMCGCSHRHVRRMKPKAEALHHASAMLDQATAAEHDWIPLVKD